MNRHSFNPRVRVRNWLLKPTADELRQQMLQIKAREAEQAQLERQEAQARAERALIQSAYDAVYFAPFDKATLSAASRLFPAPDLPVQSSSAVEKAAGAPIDRPNPALSLGQTQQTSGPLPERGGGEQ